MWDQGVLEMMLIKRKETFKGSAVIKKKRRGRTFMDMSLVTLEGEGRTSRK